MLHDVTFNFIELHKAAGFIESVINHGMPTINREGNLGATIRMLIIKQSVIISTYAYVSLVSTYLMQDILHRRGRGTFCPNSTSST